MKAKKIFVVLATCTLLASSVLPVYAKNITDSVALSVNQEISENSENSCKVTVSQGSSFVVSIPKDVSLNGKKGEENKGIYTVSVKGNIDANDIIKVIPDVSFKLKDNSGKKADIVANISQSVQSFQIGDVASADKVTITEENIVSGVSTTGVISTDELSAGNWTGFFNIKISLN